MSNLDEGQSALDEAYASGRDRGADSAAPAPEKADPKPPPEPVKAEDVADQSGKGESTQYRDPDTGRFVPLTELRTEREKRNEEARLRAEFEQRAAKAEAEREFLRQLLVQQQQPQTQQRQPERQAPDPYADPEGFIAHKLALQEEAFNRRLETMQQQATRQRLDASEVRVRAMHKDFDAAYAAFDQVAKSNPRFVEAMLEHPEPAQYVYETGKKALVFRELGDNPESYLERIRKEERARVLEELKSGGAKPQQRFPGTLADAPASGSQGAQPLSDQQMLDAAFASDRHRRVRA